MPAYNNDPDLLDRIAKLEAAVAQLQTPRVTPIVRGAIEIDDTDGTGIARIGLLGNGVQRGIEIFPGGNVWVYDHEGEYIINYIGDISSSYPKPQSGFMLQRKDPLTGVVSVVMALADLGDVADGPLNQTLNWYDKNGAVVFGDDAAGGLSAPDLVGGAFIDYLPPTNTTTSTSFVRLQLGAIEKQQPNMYANVLVQTSPGTTAEVRMTDGSGTVLGSVVSIPANDYGFHDFGDTLAGPFFNIAFVYVEARVTSGPGTVGVRGVFLYGAASGL